MKLDEKIERAAKKAASHPMARLLNTPAVAEDAMNSDDSQGWFEKSVRRDVTDWRLGQCEQLAWSIVRNDDQLSSGLEGDSLHAEFEGGQMVRSGTGREGLVLTSGSMFETALAAALQHTLLDGSGIDEARVEHTLKHGIDQLRSTIKTGKSTASLVCGLEGPRVRSLLTTPWGTVSPVPNDESEVRGRSRCAALWRREREVAVLIGSTEGGGNPAVGDEDRRVFDLLRLAFVIGTREMVPPHALWSRELYPFATFGVEYHGTGELFPYSPEADIPSVAAWADRIKAGESSAVRLASKRLPRAAIGGNREDSMIDAVVVWEALFGADTDTTFRVTASLAKLLRSDPAERRVFVSDLKKTYGIRSRIVHGSEYTKNDLPEHRKRAFTVAASAIRESLLRGPEWMGLSSTEWSEQILLE